MVKNKLNGIQIPFGLCYGFIILLIMLLMACADSEEAGNSSSQDSFDTEEYLPEYDVQRKYGSFYGMCETEEAYYAIISRENNSVCSIMYADKEGGAGDVLCNKPECMHNDKDCLANVSVSGMDLCVYDNQLYWTGTDLVDAGTLYLWRMNLDGSVREKVREIERNLWNNTWNQKVKIHRGYIYVYAIYNEVTGTTAQSEFRVYRARLDSDEEFRQIFAKKWNMETFVAELELAGNQMYIMLSNRTYDEASNHGENELFLCQIDCRTCESKVLMEEEKNLFWARTMRAEKDGIYLADATFPADTRYPGLYKYDFATGQMEQCVEWKEGDSIGRGGITEIADQITFFDVMDEDNTATVYVRGWDGELLCTRRIVFPEMKEGYFYYRKPLGGDRNGVYYEYIERDRELKYIIEVPLDEEKDVRVIWKVEPNE